MKLNLVPARTGVEWVRFGLRNFWRQPLAFISLFFLFLAVISTVSQLPLIGNLLALLALPFSTLGFMVAASVADAGAANADDLENLDGVKKPTSAVMFVEVAKAMRKEWRPLMVLGVISAVYFFLTVLLTVVVDGGQFARSYLLNEPLTAEMMASSNFRVASLLQMCLALPLLLAMWHAPALVHWYQVEPAKSIFFSLVAMFRNFGAYALFGLTWAGVFLLAIIAVSLIATVVIGVGSLGSGAGAMAVGNVLMIGTVLALAAMAQASNWFTFRDTFDPN